MRALLSSSTEAPLAIGEMARPVPEAHQLLIKVEAFGLNRADLLQLKGKYPAPPGASPLPGLEVAGTVAARGESVRGLSLSQRVAALLPSGGYAEYALAEEFHCLDIDDSMSFTEAAAIPEAFLTAFQALQWIAKVQPAERVLIHAAASGVALAAVQVARELGCEVFGTCSASKKEFCLAHGYSQVFAREQPWRAALESAVGAAGVHCVLDFVGTDYFADNVQALTRDGRLVQLGQLGGGKVAAQLDLALLMQKRAQIHGTTLRNRSKEYKGELCSEFWRWAKPRFARNVLRPVIDQIFPVTEINALLKRMSENQTHGKLIGVWS